MGLIDESAFVVIDLDDTLFAETDYQQSGFRAVAEVVRDLFGIEVEQLLLCWHGRGDPDVFGSLAAHLGLPPTAKESFLRTYRLHRPSITLSESVAAALDDVRRACAGIAILTDGRAITQRRKLAALGLGDIEAFIAEEWGGAFKPDRRRFEEIMRRHPGCRFVYVADNPEKDFQAPNRLGWTTIGVLSGRRVACNSASAADLPAHWVGEFADISSLLADGATARWEGRP
jgi:putative hydrolase of the HAD superfamily